MQQRYYDPVAGRFLSVDPVVTNANTGGSFSRYNYANNNPYKHVDPDGRNALVAAAVEQVLVKLAPQLGRVLFGGSAAAVGSGAAILSNGSSSDNKGGAPAAAPAPSAAAGAPAAGKGSGGDKDASTPTGQRGSPMDVPKGTNQPANIDGQEYGGHALDQMQGRGVTPTPVADTVQNGAQTPGNKPGRTVHTGQDGRLVVVTEGGKVVTVITK